MPVDHEYFRNTNTVQWMWYNHQDIKDHEERFVETRDMIEYLASFSAPEIVGKIIENRKNAKPSTGAATAGTTDDVAFNESIKKMFGRDPGIADAPEQAVHQLDGVMDRIKEYHEHQATLKQTSTPYNYKHWADFDME